ncbi:hypothetical protein [Streptomyces sp. NPDC057509]|uniref:hypothetical protein n=1 Tax=Streptomyces sp. NPDC057509 TaxID=3346152 RepID=UPI003680B544
MTPSPSPTCHGVRVRGAPGAVTMAVSLDLLAAGALCVGPALYPVRRGLRG